MKTEFVWQTSIAGAVLSLTAEQQDSNSRTDREAENIRARWKCCAVSKSVTLSS